MANTNKSLRIKTNINSDSSINVNLNQTYDTFEILSLKMRSEDVYRLHSANYGVIIGRVLANENFGVPNAKISVFIEADYDNDSEIISTLYPYATTATKNKDNIRYNLLPDNKLNDCHKVVGTFPNKSFLLDNETLIEVFDKYYIYTTRTNSAGDYIIMGVPTGQQTIHMDLDLSDCGILSQRPRDFVYKGYTIEQFENPNQFKTSTELDSLTQIISQNQSVNVIPFWGNNENGETIGITRADINISFKFEPTCVFMGSLVADNASNGISKKCVPTNQMGAMDELTTGEGTIEMIRKTPGDNIEEFQVKGTELIDGNGVWCYQIPMNLDYMMTDEYGNMVPTDDPTKGVPTRARVRFRISMEDAEANTDNYFRAKVLVPHNPQNLKGGGHEDYDYEFGSNTREDSFRDLFWNNVYTVKSYIPRFQKAKNNIKTERFSGIKHCNIYGQNNPMPYNNIRIRLPFEFMLICFLINSYIKLVTLLNRTIFGIVKAITGFWLSGSKLDSKVVKSLQYVLISNGLCEEMENWYFAPGANVEKTIDGKYDIEMNGQDDIYLLEERYKTLLIDNKGNNEEYGGRGPSGGGMYRTESTEIDSYSADTKSIEYNNNDGNERVCLTANIDYLVSCIEMALAQKYKIINFDFYNDWVNGVIYMPRWMRVIKKKRTFLWGLITIKQKTKGCLDDTTIFNKTRYYTQQCALYYTKDENGVYNHISTPNGCASNKQKCHKKPGKKNYPIFGGNKRTNTGNGGIVHEHETMLKQNVYYFKPCEWGQNNRKTVLFANDIVLLGSLNDCSIYGIPQAFKYLKSSTYIMPTNLALTNLEDDAYLYSTPNGTFCGSSHFYDTTGVTQVNPSFVAEEKYYSSYSNKDDKLKFGSSPDGSDIVDIFDDTIPLTEAAGISWSYTGPGQGEKSDRADYSLYMPGGHFLGISCFNSETNIKSCINLQRICEMGANLSQRREEVREIKKVDENGEEYTIKYRYFVPTGLISNDDINGQDFRTMFATMNGNRLLCEGNFVDEKTGYPFYKFNYLRNTGFGGELKSQIENDNTEFNYWNVQLSGITDEYMSLGGDIAKDVNYDEDETHETYTRTQEVANYDYYSFRFGLYDLSEEEQARHFLLWSGTDGGTTQSEATSRQSGGGRRGSSGMYRTTVKSNEFGGKEVGLPQYENSFYFYFGLRDGATAFDEFNKQFFATCDSEKIIDSRLTIGVKTYFDECELTTSVYISGKNAVSPVTISYTYISEDGETSSGNTFEDIEVTNGYYSLELEDLPRGKYYFKVIDGEGNEASRVLELGGNNDVDASIETQAFNFVPQPEMTASQVSSSGKAFDCGYISISNVSFNDNYISGTPMVTIVDEHGNYWTNSNQSFPGTQLTNISTATSIYDNDGAGEEETGEEGTILIFVWSASTDYDIYLYNNNCENPSSYYYYGKYHVDGIESFDLYLGNKEFTDFSYSEYLNGSDFIPHIDSNGDCWWSNIGDDNDEDNWYLRYFLLKRNASGEPFTNNVFAMNENGVTLNTALFGQAEKYDNEISGYTVTDTTGYEDDGRLDGVVSDMSYIPTWPTTPPYSPDYIPTYERRLYGEMALNNNNVASQPIITLKLTDIEEVETTGNVHKFVIDEVNVLPNNEIEDYIVINEATEDKYGYFIGKTDVGKLYYITVEYSDVRLFIYQGNRINGKTLTLYPVFYYPVMEKSFDAMMYVVDWMNPMLFGSSTNDATMNDFAVRYENEMYTNGFLAENGLTYQGEMGPCNFSANTIGETLMLTRYPDGTTDIDEEAFASGQTEMGSSVTPYSPTITYAFSLTEGAPSAITFVPNLININGSITATMAGYISYKNANTSNNSAYYYSDIIDNTNRYYIIDKISHPCPLIEYSYIINSNNPSLLHIVGRFGKYSDEWLNVVKEPDTFVQKPGQYVVIDVRDGSYTFPYKVNSTTTETITKTVVITGILSAVTNHDDLEWAFSGFDITLEEAYNWDENVNVIDYIDSLITEDNEIDGILIEQWDKEINVSGNTNDKYVICVPEQTENTNVIRIYPKPINLEGYSNNASEPYLIIIPSGTTGVYI